ncbi:hypothetical protein GY45DRAFT_613932 [Cubamyces sp. BRFM 1775]|nr:hypothetical protein GY45DRAFT_613932 [Cubamyces sp. BRFM 1775]
MRMRTQTVEHALGEGCACLRSAAGANGHYWAPREAGANGGPVARAPPSAGSSELGSKLPSVLADTSTKPSPFSAIETICSSALIIQHAIMIISKETRKPSERSNSRSAAALRTTMTRERHAVYGFGYVCILVFQISKKLDLSHQRERVCGRRSGWDASMPWDEPRCNMSAALAERPELP